MERDVDRDSPKCTDGQLWFSYEWTDDGVDTSYIAVAFDAERRDCACVFDANEVAAMGARVAEALYEPTEDY